MYPPRGDEDDHWCKEYGNIKVPRGWAFLPSGDAFATRQVKAMGPHWLAVKAAKGYTRKLGVWAPEKNLEAALKLAEETKEKRAVRRIVSRQQRRQAESTYRDEFAEAVFKHLDFAPRYDKLARTIARETAKRATVVGSERVGRTRKLTLEEKAVLAVRAYIRHSHTRYEDRLSNRELILDPGSFLYHEIKGQANDDVDDFLEKHRRRKVQREVDP